MDKCPDCGKEYQRINQHFAMSDCGPDDGAKKTYTCDLEGCNNTFENYPSRLETRDRKNFYCCRRHQVEGQKNGAIVECSWCGEERYKSGGQLGSMGDYPIDHHFCDKECESKFKQHNWVREGHPNWQGGSSGVNAVRNSLNERSWYAVARDHRRDKCERCGVEPDERDLDVHHIIPIISGGTNHPDNLITLCISCHRKAEEYTKKFTEPHLLKFAE